MNPLKNRKPGAAEPRKRRRIVYDAVTFSELGGVRYLHFGTEWVQGAMSLRRPDDLILEYAQQMMAWMLFIGRPAHVLQLGLGAAALTKFCYRQFPACSVTAVDLNPSVIAAAHSMFKLPPDDDRLTIIEGDAQTYVEDSLQQGRFDAIQIDLYDASARGPVLESIEFYEACRTCLAPRGIVSVNLFGDHASFGRNMKSLKQVFEGRVLALPEVHDGNRVALAFHGEAFDVPVSELIERADQIKLATRLPARTWVDGIRTESASRGGAGRLVL